MNKQKSSSALFARTLHSIICTTILLECWLIFECRAFIYILFTAYASIFVLFGMCLILIYKTHERHRTNERHRHVSPCVIGHGDWYPAWHITFSDLRIPNSQTSVIHNEWIRMLHSYTKRPHRRRTIICAGDKQSHSRTCVHNTKRACDHNNTDNT